MFLESLKTLSFCKKFNFHFVFVQIKATLAMSVICVPLAAAGAAYFSWELSHRPGDDPCDGGSYWSCSRMFWIFNVRLYLVMIYIQ